MPAFGKEGMVNINQSAPKKNYKLVKPDGTVVMSCNCKEQLESHKQNLSQSLGCELQVVEETVRCL